jgi:outer membrane receptor protein involved in Fe transport
VNWGVSAALERLVTLRLREAPQMKRETSPTVFSKTRFEVFRLLPSILVLFLGVPLFGQQRISGTVTDKKSGSPIAMATAKLESQPDGSSQTKTSDAEGRFSFAGISPGTYILSISVENYYGDRISLKLSPRSSQEVDFELNPRVAVREEVTVTARPKLLDETEAATVTTLDRNQILTLPAARRAQLTDIIAPFVASAVGSHDNLVHLRGNELSLNTFINGVSFFDNPHQLFTPGLSPDVIQSVNVITGGFPAEFGNRFGGILDLVTRSGFDADNHGSLTVGAGNFLRNNVAFDFGGHTSKLGYFAYAQAFESLRFLNTPQPERFHDFGKGGRSLVQFDYKPRASDLFKLLLTADGTNFELPNTTEDESRQRDFFQRNREQTAVLSWEHIFSPSSVISTSIYERFAAARLVPTSDPFSIQAGGLRNDITLGLKSDYSLYLGPRHSIKTGVDLMQVRLREDFHFDPRENEVEIEPFDFRGRKTGKQGSLYFQDQWRPFKNLTANLGLRYDQYSLVTSDHALSPRVNLAYAFPRAHTVLHFAYNRFFAPPPIENLLLSSHLGFEGLPPAVSHSNHFEAGVSHAVRDKVLLRMTAFWRSDKNSFETTELANVRLFAPTTFALGKAYGLELNAQLPEIKPLGLTGYFGYTTQRAFQTGPVSGGFTVEQVEAGERGPAAFDQIHTGVAGLNWHERRSGVWAGAALEYGSGTPAAFPNEEGVETRIRLPEHLVANFTLGIDFFRKDRRRVSLQFNLENATNRVFAIAKESEFTPIQFSPPRFLSGSLKFHF